MKKLFFTLLISIGLFFVSNAQLGVRAGLNLASFTTKAGGLSINSDSKIGFHVGVTNDLKFTDNLTFRPGLLYSAKGGKFSIDVLGQTESIEASYSYVEIPLSFIYNFTKEESGFFAEAGPYVGFLLSAKSEDEDIKEDFNSLDFGLNIGLGYDLGNIVIGANYGLGLANIAKTEDGDDVTATNKNISAYAIYQF